MVRGFAKCLFADAIDRNHTEIESRSDTASRPTGAFLRHTALHRREGHHWILTLTRLKKDHTFEVSGATILIVRMDLQEIAKYETL